MIQSLMERILTFTKFEYSCEKKLRVLADNRFSYSNSLFVFRGEKRCLQYRHLEAIFFSCPIKYLFIIALFFFNNAMYVSSYFINFASI